MCNNKKNFQSEKNTSLMCTFVLYIIIIYLFSVCLELIFRFSQDEWECNLNLTHQRFKLKGLRTISSWIVWERRLTGKKRTQKRTFNVLTTAGKFNSSVFGDRPIASNTLSTSAIFSTLSPRFTATDINPVEASLVTEEI